MTGAYLAVFALMALPFVGVPAIGQQGVGLGALVAGLAVGAGCVTLAVRYYQRHKARRQSARVSGREVSGDSLAPGPWDRPGASR